MVCKATCLGLHINFLLQRAVFGGLISSVSIFPPLRDWHRVGCLVGLKAVCSSHFARGMGGGVVNVWHCDYMKETCQSSCTK